MAILRMDQLTRVTIGTNQGTIWTRDALVQIAVRLTIMCQHDQPKNRARKRQALPIGDCTLWKNRRHMQIGALPRNDKENGS